METPLWTEGFHSPVKHDKNASPPLAVEHWDREDDEALPDGITMTTQETLKYVQDYDMIILGFEKLENMHNLK